jgi:hypothetical protein
MLERFQPRLNYDKDSTANATPSTSQYEEEKKEREQEELRKKIDLILFTGEKDGKKLPFIEPFVSAMNKQMKIEGQVYKAEPKLMNIEALDPYTAILNDSNAMKEKEALAKVKDYGSRASAEEVLKSVKLYKAEFVFPSDIENGTQKALPLIIMGYERPRGNTLNYGALSRPMAVYERYCLDHYFPGVTKAGLIGLVSLRDATFGGKEAIEMGPIKTMYSSELLKHQFTLGIISVTNTFVFLLRQGDKIIMGNNVEELGAKAGKRVPAMLK